jgi:hypothetical protein
MMYARFGRAGLCLTLGCAVLFVATARSEEPPPSDQQAAKPQPAAADDPGKSDKPAKPLDAELLKALEEKSAPEAEEEAPLVRVGRRMREVETRLVKTDAGDETVNLQEGIVQDLDKLIEQMRKGGG